MKKIRKGFTLVELLIVIAIIGALAASMTLSAGDSAARARAAAIANNYKVISSGLALYIVDTNNSGDVPSVAGFSAVSPDYITANVADYLITSGDGGSEGKKGTWYATYQGRYKTDANVIAALKQVSTDMRWVGFKARVY